jgi:hypothetical protein
VIGGSRVTEELAASILRVLFPEFLHLETAVRTSVFKMI